VAAPKKKNDNAKSLFALIFWVVFIVTIITIFIVKKDVIETNFNKFISGMRGDSDPVEDLPADEIVSSNENSIAIIVERQQVTEPAAETSQTDETTQPAGTAQSTNPTASAEPTAPVVPPAAQTTPPVTPPQTPQVQTRDRAIYFTQVTNDGQILQTRTTRRVPLTETPLQDVLGVLLEGPSTDELNRNIINFIPENTRMLSATVRGNTAYINFNENFLFNRFGVDGYVAQLRQIIWTVTEFQNINDVQILIDGRRMDYLGEGIWIGSPISRYSF